MEFEWYPEHLSDGPQLEGPSIPITILMVKKVISKMKFCKADGPSGAVVEMNRAAVDTGATITVTSPFIRDGKDPADWEQSFIVCLYKGKGDMLWMKATIED